MFNDICSIPDKTYTPKTASQSPPNEDENEEDQDEDGGSDLASISFFIDYLTSILLDIYLPLTRSQRSASQAPAFAANEGMYSLPDYHI